MDFFDGGSGRNRGNRTSRRRRGNGSGVAVMGALKVNLVNMSVRARALMSVGDWRNTGNVKGTFTDATLLMGRGASAPSRRDVPLP